MMTQLLLMMVSSCVKRPRDVAEAEACWTEDFGEEISGGGEIYLNCQLRRGLLKSVLFFQLIMSVPWRYVDVRHIRV